MGDAVKERMNAERIRIEKTAQKLPSLYAVIRIRNEQIIDNLWNRALSGVRNSVTENIHKLELIGKSIEAADPVLILKRGYTLTRCDGHVVRSVSDLQKGVRITSVFPDGTVESEII